MNGCWLRVVILGSWIGLLGGRSLADDPASRLDLDEATQTRCLAVLREGLRSDEFWPAMHAAEGLSRSGFGDEVQRALEPKLSEENDDQHRCGLARELVRAGDLRACGS